MNKKVVIIIVIIAVLLIGIVVIGNYYRSQTRAAAAAKYLATHPVTNRPPAQPIVVTKENMPSYLANQQVIKDLPSDAKILLKLYSGDGSGNKIWEESYSITKGKVTLGTVDSPDITINLDSVEVPDLGNFCGAIQKAKAAGNVGFELGLGKASLLWKYGGMMKYKSCFGM